MLEFVKTKQILNIDRNAKTVKGQKYGFMTAILYLAPSTQSGFNVCPQASNGCKRACLYSAGHGAYKTVKQGRINKTLWYIQERKTFLDKLRKEGRLTSSDTEYRSLQEAPSKKDFIYNTYAYSGGGIGPAIIGTTLLVFGSIIIAAATTGPAIQPLPTSSIPMAFLSCVQSISYRHFTLTHPN